MGPQKAKSHPGRQLVRPAGPKAERARRHAAAAAFANGDVVGTVQEFKYTNPHSYLLLEVKAADGSTAVWNLEGRAPSLLTRDGWTSTTLKPGDEIIIMVNPLRSGAPGGSWNTSTPKFKDGRSLGVTP